jgi:similar to stage IV sporulation protein
MECSGESLHRLINDLVSARVDVKDIEWVDEQKIHLSFSVRHFATFVAAVRRHQLRMRIRGKNGLVFLLYQAQRRKGFVIGMALFFIFLLWMSSLVWRVDIVGNHRLPENQVRSLLVTEGVYAGRFKWDLPSAEEVQHRLLSQLSDLSWVGYHVQGTRVLITVVEKKRPEVKKDEFANMGPVDLVANKKAMVRGMRVLQGQPLVEVNDIVQKGQRLVSGVYEKSPPEGEEEKEKESKPKERRLIGAKGKVWGEVWYESTIKMPLRQERRILSGQRQNVYFPYVGQVVIPVPFGHKPDYHQSITRKTKISFNLFGVQFPIGLQREEYLQTEVVKQTLTLKQAEQLALTRVREEFRQTVGREGRILGEKILHRSVDNDKVYLKIHFDVMENIAVPQPILQGE